VFFVTPKKTRPKYDIFAMECLEQICRKILSPFSTEFYSSYDDTTLTPPWLTHRQADCFWPVILLAQSAKLESKKQASELRKWKEPNGWILTAKLSCQQCLARNYADTDRLRNQDCTANADEDVDLWSQSMDDDDDEWICRACHK